MVARRARRVIPVQWRAHDDLGIGHALLRHPPAGHLPTRYLCNRMALAERFAWPVRLRCSVCKNRLDELEREVATVQAI